MVTESRVERVSKRDFSSLTRRGSNAKGSSWAYRQECRTDFTVPFTELRELIPETTKVCEDISSCNHTDWGGVYIRIIVVSGFRYIAKWGSWDARGKFHPSGVQEITCKEVQTADYAEINLRDISAARKERGFTGSVNIIQTLHTTLRYACT
jgi:hypothetical protein